MAMPTPTPIARTATTIPRTSRPRAGRGNRFMTAPDTQLFFGSSAVQIRPFGLAGAVEVFRQGRMACCMTRVETKDFEQPGISFNRLAGLLREPIQVPSGG